VSEVYLINATFRELAVLSSSWFVNVKVKLSLCLTKHHDGMKTYRGSGSIAPCILDLCIR
jgi:hypothetical protein